MKAGTGRCPGLEWAGLNLVWAGLECTGYQTKGGGKKWRARIGRGSKGWSLCVGPLVPRRGVRGEA